MHEQVLRLLNHGDVWSSELFYQTPCLTKCTNHITSLNRKQHRFNK